MNWNAFFQNAQLIGSRYFLLALIGFLLFYVLFRNKWLYKKIQQRFPKNKDYAREIIYSVVTMLIFSLISSMVFTHPSIRPHTTMYLSLIHI